MTRRIALLTTLLVLALPAPAGAQSGAFGPLPAAQPTPTPTADGRQHRRRRPTGRNVLFIIGGALIVGFGVMGWFILRDARGTIREAELADTGLRDAGPAQAQDAGEGQGAQEDARPERPRKAHRKR